MADPSTGFWIDLAILVILPAIVGPILTKWAGDAAKQHGSIPAAVRGIRILVTAVWLAIVTFGVTLLVGPVGFLSTLTVSAIGGIAVTLALQTTLQNIVAGFILLRSRFLRNGDLVLFGGVEGTVVTMGLISTVLKLRDGTLAFVSNSNLLSGPLVNRSTAERLKGEY